MSNFPFSILFIVFTTVESRYAYTYGLNSVDFEKEKNIYSASSYSTVFDQELRDGANSRYFLQMFSIIPTAIPEYGKEINTCEQSRNELPCIFTAIALFSLM